MQAAVSRQALCLPQRAADTTHAAAQQLALVPARRRAPKLRPVTTAAFGTAAAVGSGLGGLQAASQLVGFALAAAFVGFQLKQEQDAMEKEGKRECATCQGTGLVPCICTRWNDRDVGCGACGGSGMMECTSCGGGGTAVPIEAKVYIKSQGSRPRTYY